MLQRASLLGFDTGNAELSVRVAEQGLVVAT